MKIEHPRSRWGWVIGLLILLVLLAAIPFLFFRPAAEELPGYHIQNFIGKVEVYWAERKAWFPANRGEVLKADDKIRTGPGAEADLRVPGQVRLRVKENSELLIKRPPFFRRALRYRLHLLQGSLLGSTQKGFEEERLEISTPVLVAAVRGTTFQIEMNPQTQESAVRVLEGSVKVTSAATRKTVIVKTLEKTEVLGKADPLRPIRVTRKEWDRLKEGYELFEKSAIQEAKQIDLSKKAGNLFQYVFDHGDFFTPNFGYVGREFFKDEKTGEVYLKIDYDVFPTGSFVGMYMKTRGLDLTQFQGFEFQARTEPEEGFPEGIRIEMKASSGILRAFVPRDFTEKWQTFHYPFRVRPPGEISEVTIVFSNEKAKAHKKGSLYFRHFTLIPLTSQDTAET